MVFLKKKSITTRLHVFFPVVSSVFLYQFLCDFTIIIIYYHYIFLLIIFSVVATVTGFLLSDNLPHQIHTATEFL